MLLSLSIKNYALIESLETDFSNQFSVITGETGAGKSILLGALGLVLGNRADLTSLKDKEFPSDVDYTNGNDFKGRFPNFEWISFTNIVSIPGKPPHSSGSRQHSVE